MPDGRRDLESCLEVELEGDVASALRSRSATLCANAGETASDPEFSVEGGRGNHVSVAGPVRPRGVEPPACGLGSRELQTQGSESQEVTSAALQTPAVPPAPGGRDGASQGDPAPPAGTDRDLGRVVAWPHLAGPLRAAVLALVGAASRTPAEGESTTPDRSPPA